MGSQMSASSKKAHALHSAACRNALGLAKLSVALLSFALLSLALLSFALRSLALLYLAWLSFASWAFFWYMHEANLNSGGGRFFLPALEFKFALCLGGVL